MVKLIWLRLIDIGGYMKISVCVIVDLIINFGVKGFILLLSGGLVLVFCCVLK